MNCVHVLAASGYAEPCTAVSIAKDAASIDGGSRCFFSPPGEQLPVSSIRPFSPMEIISSLEGFVGCASLRGGIGHLRKRNCTLAVAAALRRYTVSPNGWLNLACDHTVPASSSSSSKLPCLRARFVVTVLLPNTVPVLSPQIVPGLGSTPSLKYLWATLDSHQRSLRTDSCFQRPYNMGRWKCQK